MKREAKLNDPNHPLVTIVIPNYNYGKYLRQCFNSVIAQTYENIEICFSDNNSTDNSWSIAQEYQEKYPGVMNISRNRKNFGVAANWLNCTESIKGKYYVQLCSDDAMMPTFVEKCVNVLEKYNETGFALVHRMIIDEDNNYTKEAPFYNESCLITGPEQAAVYMMAAVNPSISQVMYVKHKTIGKAPSGNNLGAGQYASRILDFNICTEFPIVYIKEPLVLHRLHSKNDSLRAAGNLMEVIGPYVLNQQFALIASINDMQKVTDRLPSSLEKLSHLCLRYCIRALLSKNATEAHRYFHLSIAISPTIIEDEQFKKLDSYWTSNEDIKKKIIDTLTLTDNFITRTISYKPPIGSIPI